MIAARAGERHCTAAKMFARLCAPHQAATASSVDVRLHQWLGATCCKRPHHRFGTSRCCKSRRARGVPATARRRQRRGLHERVAVASVAWPGLPPHHLPSQYSLDRSVQQWRQQQLERVAALHRPRCQRSRGWAARPRQPLQHARFTEHFGAGRSSSLGEGRLNAAAPQAQTSLAAAGLDN